MPLKTVARPNMKCCSDLCRNSGTTLGGKNRLGHDYSFFLGSSQGGVATSSGLDTNVLFQRDPGYSLASVQDTRNDFGSYGAICWGELSISKEFSAGSQSIFVTVRLLWSISFRCTLV